MNYGIAQALQELKDPAIDAMIDSFDKQDDPYVGAFWYDPDREELYGQKPTLASDIPFYHSSQWSKDVRTGRALHKSIWKKEHFKGKDPRFTGDYTEKPRGRVFEFKDEGFIVFTGSWIKDYPEAKQLIIDEFQLPSDNTQFKIDDHWEIGHGWSDEF